MWKPIIDLHCTKGSWVYGCPYTDGWYSFKLHLKAPGNLKQKWQWIWNTTSCNDNYASNNNRMWEICIINPMYTDTIILPSGHWPLRSKCCVTVQHSWVYYKLGGNHLGITWPQAEELTKYLTSSALLWFTILLSISMWLVGLHNFLCNIYILSFYFSLWMMCFL